MAGVAVLGFLAGLAIFILFIISLTKKQTKGWWLLGGGISIMVFIIGIIGSYAATGNPSSSASNSISAPSNSNSSEIVIKYSVKTTNVVGSPYPTTAGAGNVFALVTLDIQNNGYASFDTNPYNFSLIADNFKFYASIATYSLPDTLKTVSVLDKGDVKGSLAFEVPSSSTNLSINYQTLVTPNIRWVKQ